VGVLLAICLGLKGIVALEARLAAYGDRLIYWLVMVPIAVVSLTACWVVASRTKRE
jgi:membrane protein DedA with SNARE-associated domain